MLGGFLVFVIVQTRRERTKRREREFNYFLRKAEEKEIDQQHVQFLSRVVQAVGTDQPYRILDSFDIFQHCCDSYAKKQKFTDQEGRHFHQTVDKVKDALGFTKIEEAVPLSTSHDIKGGQPVKLKLNREGQDYEYDATVLENEDKNLTLEALNLDLDYMKIGFDTMLQVDFQRESDAGYRFRTTISRAPDSAGKRLFLKHPGLIERNQARNFSRMEVTFPFSYYQIEKERFNNIEIDSNLQICENRPVFRAETFDISGGGIAFLTHHKVGKGDHLYLNFQKLSEEHTEPLLAEVVWSGKEKDRKALLVRARFCGITEKMQDALMKFVYQMQRRFARKLKFAPKR